jgi:hypothetical protein
LSPRFGHRAEWINAVFLCHDAHAPGHMPLYCAAQWIATKGGTQSFEPTYSTIWERAYSDLLARISSNQVTVTGVRSGVREKLEGYLFASIAIDYPFAGTSIDLIVKDELHLQSYAYTDDESWRRGFDDCLRDPRGIQWSQLMGRGKTSRVGGRLTMSSRRQKRIPVGQDDRAPCT